MDDKILQLLTQMSEDIGHLKGTSEATLEQATKTNGRLLRAEGEISELKTFRTKVATYGTIAGTLIAVVTTAITNYFL